VRTTCTCVLDAHANKLPLRRLFVATQGKSYALNEIVQRLHGDLVLWTDDDVLFERDWIELYLDAARRWPGAAFFGGNVIPTFFAEEPAWLRPAWPTLSGVFAAREFDDGPFRIDRKRLPFGANMATRVATQKRYTYDTNLGRRGDLLLSGEETALMQKWIDDGLEGRWVPDSRVHHLITPDRMDLPHIERFFFSLGESEKFRPKTWSTLPARLASIAWFTTSALLAAAKHSRYRLDKNPYWWIRYLQRQSYYWGRVEGQWGGLPNWLRPAPIQRLRKIRVQPRYTGPGTQAFSHPREMAADQLEAA